MVLVVVLKEQDVFLDLSVDVVAFLDVIQLRVQLLANLLLLRVHALLLPHLNQHFRELAYLGKFLRPENVIVILVLLLVVLVEEVDVPLNPAIKLLHQCEHLPLVLESFQAV